MLGLLSHSLGDTTCRAGPTPHRVVISPGLDRWTSITAACVGLRGESNALGILPRSFSLARVSTPTQPSWTVLQFPLPLNMQPPSLARGGGGGGGEDRGHTHVFALVSLRAFNPMLQVFVPVLLHKVIHGAVGALSEKSSELQP